MEREGSVCVCVCVRSVCVGGVVWIVHCVGANEYAPNNSITGVFFDTFGEVYDDQREFHENVPCLLKPGGVYSFFNGLGATNAFFHDVYCHIVDLEFRRFGISTCYERVDIDVSSATLWEGVKRQYWNLPFYNLPICTMATSF